MQKKEINQRRLKNLNTQLDGILNKYDKLKPKMLSLGVETMAVIGQMKILMDEYKKLVGLEITRR